MALCEICNREFNSFGNLQQHIKKCEKLHLIKDEIIDLYVNKNYSVRDLRKKFKLQSDDIKIILGDKTRSLAEANKLAHKKYPDNYKHTEESKKIMREKRLEFMKNNPDKTAWRLSNVSYPEKLFIELHLLIKWLRLRLMDPNTYYPKEKKETIKKRNY